VAHCSPYLSSKTAFNSPADIAPSLHSGGASFDDSIDFLRPGVHLRRAGRRAGIVSRKAEAALVPSFQSFDDPLYYFQKLGPVIFRLDGQK
jgi:hypothetical protein